MKAGREHRVPLSPRALEALDGAAELFGGQGDGQELVFPSPTGRVLNHATLTSLLHGLGIDIVAHGFRASFRDWAAECTDAPRLVRTAREGASPASLATPRATARRPVPGFPARSPRGHERSRAAAASLFN